MDSSPISITDVPGDDEVALNARITEVVRRYKVNAVLHDDRDSNGNAVVVVFADDAEAVELAVGDLSGNR